MRIPEEVVENIRQESNILDVVSQYVQMKKRGKNHFAFCPFHEEKTPSFSVREEKQMFHCFSCGRGGNVFSFIMEIEGMSFPEAVIKTAELADISIDPKLANSVDQYKPSEDSQTGQLLSLHEHAKDFYHHILMHTKTGESALEYLEQRGLQRSTIEQFQIGFAPDQRYLLKTFASEKKGWEEEILEKSGLFLKKDDGTFQDRFYNRIMFPLLNHQGRTVAFSGRIFKENPEFKVAKYLNSPETDIFNKRTLLFNFEEARPSIRKEKETYLFEGFMDVIAAYQAGILNAVATMGTSLTSEHIQQLEKITDHIILSFDGDSAGKEAIKRSAEFITKETPFSLEITPFPEGLDPDDFIQNKGTEAFLNFMKNSRLTFIGFLMLYHKTDKNLHNDSQRIEYINTILTEMTHVSSAVEREVYFKQLSEEFELPIETLREQFQTVYLNYKKESVFERKQRSKEGATSHSFVQVKNQGFLDSKVLRAEKQLLNRVFHFEEARIYLTNNYSNFEFYTEEFNHLYLLFEQFSSIHTSDMGAFIEYLKESDAKKLAVEIDWLSFGTHLTNEELDDCIRIIQQQQWVEKLNLNKKELHEAQKNNDLHAQQKLVAEIIDLNRQIKTTQT